MTWRYQPVIVTSVRKIGKKIFREKYICLISVHLYKNGKLRRWSADPVHAAWPIGETTRELQAELARMSAAAYVFKPVPYKSLKVGMTLERAI